MKFLGNYFMKKQMQEEAQLTAARLDAAIISLYFALDQVKKVSAGEAVTIKTLDQTLRNVKNANSYTTRARDSMENMYTNSLKFAIERAKRQDTSGKE